MRHVPCPSSNQIADPSKREACRFFWLNQGFDSTTASIISGTTLAEIILRNTDTTKQNANVFYVGAPPTGTWHTNAPPALELRNLPVPPWLRHGM